MVVRAGEMSEKSVAEVARGQSSAHCVGYVSKRDGWLTGDENVKANGKEREREDE